jgi:hypothetical protein
VCTTGGNGFRAGFRAQVDEDEIVPHFVGLISNGQTGTITESTIVTNSPAHDAFIVTNGARVCRTSTHGQR